MTQAQLLQLVLALVFVVGLLLSLAWLARRSGWIRQRTNRTDLKVLGILRLGARSSVAVVQVEGARLVLGITTQQVTLLHTLAAAADVPPGTGTGEFAAQLARSLPRP